MSNGTFRLAKTERAILALLQYKDVLKAADVIGVNASTLHRWLKDPRFIAQLNRARAQVFSEGLARLQEAETQAAEIVIRAMTNPKLPPQAQVKCATYILDRARTNVALKLSDSSMIETEGFPDLESADENTLVTLADVKRELSRTFEEKSKDGVSPDEGGIARPVSGSVEPAGHERSDSQAADSPRAKPQVQTAPDAAGNNASAQPTSATTTNKPSTTPQVKETGPEVANLRQSLTSIRLSARPEATEPFGRSAVSPTSSRGTTEGAAVTQAAPQSIPTARPHTEAPAPMSVAASLDSVTPDLAGPKQRMEEAGRKFEELLAEISRKEGRATN